jgi:hypothetical protein
MPERRGDVDELLTSLNTDPDDSDEVLARRTAAVS